MNIKEREAHIEKLLSWQAMRDKGMTLREIGALVGRHNTQVHGDLLKLPDHQRILATHKEKLRIIYNLHATGINMSQAARKMNIKQSQIEHLLSLDGTTWSAIDGSSKPQRNDHQASTVTVIKRAKPCTEYNKCSCGREKRKNDTACPVCYTASMYEFAGIKRPEYFPPSPSMQIALQH